MSTMDNNNEFNDSQEPSLISFNSINSDVITNKRLFEIKDEEVLSRLSSIIPDACQVISNTKLALGGIYQAFLLAGARLAKSKDMAGAVRGFYHGANGINGHANFINKNGVIITNAVMRLASVVVGQYYMAQINKQLGDINNQLAQISEFQNNEYQSEIANLMQDVMICSDFRLEIADNEELRKHVLDSLERYGEKCGQLIEQANITMKGYNKKLCNQFSEYEKMIPESLAWFQYQQILLLIMNKISELKYVLNSGSISAELCNSKYLICAKSAEKALIVLRDWHLENSKKFHIDSVSKTRTLTVREKCMKLFMPMYSSISLVKDLASDGVRGAVLNALDRKTIDDQTFAMLDQFSKSEETNFCFETDLFFKDVSIIAKDGKIYYMLE